MIADEGRAHRRAVGALACAVSLFAACGGGQSGTDARVDPADTDAAVPDAAGDLADASLPPGAPPVGGCRDGWCWVSPLSQGNPLTGIWGASATDVWAIGDHGTIVHYRNGAWSLHGGGELDWGAGGARIWGTGANDVWGATGAGVVHWNGTAWSLSAPGNILSVGGTGPNDVWAYDFTTKGALQWNGATWTPRPLPAAGWRGLAFGGAPGEALFVSTTGGIARWQGSSWGILDAGTHTANRALVIDATHVIVTQVGAVVFWDGATWTTRTPPVRATWDAVAATSFDDVWVIGAATGHRYRYHWDGHVWSGGEDSDAPGITEALWIDPAGAPWAALTDGQVRVWNGVGWTAKTSGDNDLASVWGTAENDIWAMSTDDEKVRNRALHWNGSTWTEVRLPFDASYWFRKIWGSAPDDYWIAAGKWNARDRMERTVVHWDGKAWTAMGPFGSEDAIFEPVGFTSIWGAAANDIYAVGRTALYHYDGHAWTQVTDVPGGNDVIGTAGNDVYVVQDSNLWHWDGLHWTSKEGPPEMGAGWANSPTDIWLAARTACAIHYDGAAFTVLDGGGMEGVPLGSAGDMYTFGFGPGSHMTRWSGSTGTATPEFFAPWSGWRAPSGRVYAAGRGLLVH